MSVHDHRIAAWPPQRNLACRTARSAGKRPARGPGAGGGRERLRRTQVGPQKAGRRVFRTAGLGRVADGADRAGGGAGVGRVGGLHQ